MATTHPSAPVNRTGDHRCACGQILRVFGRDRHRLYYEPAKVVEHDPVMNGRCPACGAELPGKNSY